jgi:6-phosphofructokinase 1
MPEKSKSNVKFDTKVETLGPAKIPSPMPVCKFVPDKAKARVFVTDDFGASIDSPLKLDVEFAGPRENIYFDAPKTKCAIVTCGGLCPGTNDIIRSIVMEAHHNYGVAASLGIRFGLEGFIPRYDHEIMELTPDSVADIHQFGGTMLGSSRGPQSEEEIVDALERLNVNILFVIGGDGTMKAARKIQDEIARRKLKISVIGIPKTIDNDISFVSRTFGFDTAVEKATEAIQCAHIEATCAYNGVGLVKVMGRESGFIAAQAALALKEVNFVLVPEAPFKMHGENGLLVALRKRLERRSHAVILVAEGAGQEYTKVSGKKDASGNPVLGDISEVLISEIKSYFKERNMPLTLKFIDPSYIIRSIPANANDRVYCGFLGHHAVHAAMSGRTGMAVSKLQDCFVHLPFGMVTTKRKKLNIDSEYWRSVLESTGQARDMAVAGGREEVC